VCGAVSGGISAFLTTPLDVAKTRIILADKSSNLASGNIITALRIVYREKQIKGQVRSYKCMTVILYFLFIVYLQA